MMNLTMLPLVDVMIQQIILSVLFSWGFHGCVIEILQIKKNTLPYEFFSEKNFLIPYVFSLSEKAKI